MSENMRPVRFWRSKKVIGILLIILAVLLVYLAVFCYSERRTLTQNPFDFSYKLNNPTYISRIENGNIYVIDAFQQRITELSPDGVVKRIIQDETGGRYSCYSMVTANNSGDIYAYELLFEFGGQSVRELAVAKVNRGSSTAKEIFITPALGTKLRKYNSLTQNIIFSDERLAAFEQYDHRVVKYVINCNSLAIDKIDVKLPFELNRLLHYDVAANSIDGRIALYDGLSSVFFVEQDGRLSKTVKLPKELIPFDLQMASDGDLIFLDLGTNSIYEIRDGNCIVAIDGKQLMQSFGKYAPEKLVFTPGVADQVIVINGTRLRIIEPGKGIVKISILRLGEQIIIYRFVVWTMFVVFILLLLTALVVAVIAALRPENSMKTLRNSALVVLLVILTAVIVAHSVYTSMLKQYYREVENDMKYFADNIAHIEYFEKIANINNRVDFNSKEFSEIEQRFDKMFDDFNKDVSTPYYGDVYRYDADGLKYLISSDSNDARMQYLPIDRQKDIVAKVAVRNGESARVYTGNDWIGKWMYVLLPLKDSSGKIHSIIEVGRNISEFELRNQKILVETITGIVSLLVVVILVALELLLSARRVERDVQIDFKKIRLLALISAAPVAALVPIIPLLAANFSGSLWGMSKTQIMALPYSIELLSVIIVYLYAGRMATKVRWRTQFLLGMGLFSLSAFGTWLAPNIGLFLCSRVFAGIATGLMANSLKVIPLATDGSDEWRYAQSQRNAGRFSGIIIGGVSGTWLYSNWLGNDTVLLVVLVSLASVLIASKLLKSSKTEQLPEVFHSGLRGLYKLITDRQAGFFILCFMLPVMMMDCFASLIIPVYTNQNNLPAEIIGQCTMISSLCIAWLSAPLTKIMVRIYSVRYAMVLGYLIYFAGFLIFAWQYSIIGAFIAAMFIGVGLSFAVTPCYEYMIHLPITKKLGKQSVGGYYNILVYGCTSIGMMIMGRLFSVGVQRGVLIMTVFGICFITLFTTINWFRRSR